MDADLRTAVARAIWNLLREREDKCDLELEDMQLVHSIWSYADAALSAARGGGEAVALEELHPDTRSLVNRFANALAEKLLAAQRKYGYSDGWASPDWMDECRQHLNEHVAKGDPRDVAAYCAFLWHHGESTAPPAPAIPEGSEALRLLAVMFDSYENGDDVTDSDDEITYVGKCVVLADSDFNAIANLLNGRLPAAPSPEVAR